MENSSYLKAKVLVLIPVFIFFVTMICMVLATILEGPTNRGALYSVVAFIGVMSLFFAPLPCLIISIIGTVFASKASREGVTEANRFLILGIIEILVYVFGAVLAVLMFIAGQGV